MKEGKMHRLNEDRVQKLNDIGFVWVAKSNEKWKQLEHDRIVSSCKLFVFRMSNKYYIRTYMHFVPFEDDDIWEKLYQELLKFKKKHGKQRIPFI
jgi:hypothetical protein